MEKFKKLQDEYTANIFRNYKIQKEMQELLSEEFKQYVNKEKCKEVYVAVDSSYPNYIGIPECGSYKFKDTFQYDFYVEYTPQCYSGTSVEGLLEFNKQKLEKLKEIEAVGIKLYKIVKGRDLDLTKFNISEIIKKIEEGK